MAIAYSGLDGAGRPTDREGTSKAFFEKLQAAQIDAVLIGSPNQTHGEINQEFGTPGDPVTRAVMEFLARQIKP